MTSQSPENDPVQDATPVAYAGVVTRLIALTLDALLIDAAALLVTGAVLLVKSVFSVSSGHHQAVWAVIAAALFAIWVIFYFAIFWTATGQTLGNRVMHIQVTRSDGARLRPRHALVRLAGMVISLPLFWGYVPILASTRRRGVFDVMAGTVVTVVAPVPPMSQSPTSFATPAASWATASDRDDARDPRSLIGAGPDRDGAVNGGDSFVQAAEADAE